MSNALSIFSFDNSVVRTSIDAQGAPWFCVRDVAECLELANVTHVQRLVEESEITSVVIYDSIGRSRETPFINESGLYRVLFRSDSQLAKPFQDWLAKEVLPSIRKNGSYGATRSPIPAGADEAVRLLPTFIAAAKACGLSDNQAQLAADNAIKKLTNNTIKPLELMGIQLIEEKKELIFTPTQLAVELNSAEFSSAKKVNILLAARGFQRRTEAGWEPTELGKKHAELLATGKNHSSGAPVLQLKWRSSILDLLA